MKRRRPPLKAPAVGKAISTSTETVRNWIKGYRSTGGGERTSSIPDAYDLAAYDLAAVAYFLEIDVRELEEIGRGDAAQELYRLHHETVRHGIQADEKTATDELRFRRPENVSDDEWERVKAAQHGYWAAQLDQVARER